MDGVLVASEQLWQDREPAYLSSILPQFIATQIIGKTRGYSVSLIYEWAMRLGYTGNKQLFYGGYHDLAKTIYKEAPITPGIDELLFTLAKHRARVGLVSSSPKDWIMAVVSRLKNAHAFSFIESVDDHPTLKPKPAPDGYLAAMNALSAIASETLIIEDSQTGINAAIASGAHVCCFALHNDGELPHGVEIYAHTIKELDTVCRSFSHITDSPEQ